MHKYKHFVVYLSVSGINKIYITILHIDRSKNELERKNVKKNMRKECFRINYLKQTIIQKNIYIRDISLDYEIIERKYIHMYVAGTIHVTN